MIIRNLSVTDIELDDLGGITIEGLSDYNLKEESQNDINNSIDLNNAIIAGDIIYLDPAGNPLTTQESLDMQSSSLMSSIMIQKSGTNITNTPHQILNFVSGGTVITDNANGSVDISIDSNSATWGNITGILSSQTDLQSALNSKEPANANIQSHIADNSIHFTQASISITESQISNLQAYLLPGDNVSTLTNDAGYLTSFTETDPVFISQKGVANGVATLGTDGKIPSSQIPAIAISETSVVASESAMLALAAQKGDVAVRTDINDSFILKGTDPSLLVDWQKLLTPTDSVLSVNGQTGIVVLTTTDITEGSNLYYTESRVSANTDVAANTTHRTDTTNPHNVTKAQVGLGNADNTSDLSKPISTATQTALDGKEDDLLNPSVNGYLLSSTTLGVRSWIDPATVGVTDHGLLTGLGDDDHIQYHNDARGDARYYTKTLLDAGQLDNRYYTETEVNSLLANKSDVGHTHVMADITDSTWISDITNQSIKNLSDVNSTMSPTNGQVLTWNNTNSEWEAQTSSGGLTAPAICFRHNGSVTQSLTSSFSTINIATNVRTDGSYYIYASNQITILQAGWYKVTYTVTFDAAGGHMGGYSFDTQSQLEINSAMVPGSVVYNSGYNYNSNSASANIWINVSANDILRIRSKELSGSAVTEANSCRITVEFYG